MKYVVDANVALRWVLSEPYSEKAIALRDEFQRGMHELIAPDFFPVEVAHALTRAERRRAIPQGQAVVLLSDILTYSPRMRKSRPLVLRATELSSQTRASVYDCIYLVLAEEQQCPFVTADRKILSAFPGLSRIVELSTL